MRLAFLALCLIPFAFGAKPAFKAGTARVDITPDGPIWMSGYASRTHPSTGVLTRLSAKALALEDSRHRRVLIITTDLIGLPRAITDAVSARLAKEQGLERSRILFNSSHTHTGPVVRGNLATMFNLGNEDAARVDEYGRVLADKLFTVASAALGDLQPADLAYGRSTAGFAINRRLQNGAAVRLADNPKGPVDHTVPVFRVTAANGKVKAILFGYACHNTTLTGDFFEISGDYAGYAQEAVEAANPGATALFILLCAGDQNPSPRSAVALARQHGEALAKSVNEAVTGGDMKPLRGNFETAFEITELNFAVHTRETFEGDLNNGNPFIVRRAKQMLAAYETGHPIRHTPYPVQAIRFGGGPVLLTLGGEVVIDYDLRAKREYPGAQLIVAGYSNDVMCYIPSVRVLKEGGYEAVDSMIYYGQPGPFAEDVEDRVFEAIHHVMKRVGLEQGK